MVIAVDFDGTIVEHEYPEIGKPVPGAFKWLKEFKNHGADLILWTMRSDSEASGNTLQQAVDFCRTNGVEFWGVNTNPTQETWTKSRKVYAHAYIDDAAVGCPLRENPRSGGRQFVDWDIVGPSVMKLIAYES